MSREIPSVRFNNLIHFLVPEEFDINRTGELIGISAMIDVIVENGKADPKLGEPIATDVQSCSIVSGDG